MGQEWGIGSGKGIDERGSNGGLVSGGRGKDMKRVHP